MADLDSILFEICDCNVFVLFYRYLHGSLCIFEQRVGGAGGSDLFCQFLDSRVVGQEEWQAHQVGDGDGGIHRGRGMQIHQLTDDGQAEICEQQFARNSLGGLGGGQDGEARGADVSRLFRLNQSR